MGNYGIKTSKKGKNATSTDALDILMTTKYAFAKIDPTQTDSFRTTTVTFLQNTTEAVKTLIYSFPHGYDYIPQVWGLWGIVWGAGTYISGTESNGYGSISSSTGFPSATISYGVDVANVNLYAYWTDPFDLSPIDLTGTVVVLTTYVFADDMTAQDYTVD